MDPALESVLRWLYENCLKILAIGAIFIQITPIKWNPLTSLLKWIGRLITSDTNTKIETMKSEIKEMREDLDENEKDRIRWEVLDFANSCRNGRSHSRDEFQHIITLNDKYKALLARTNDKNGVFNSEYKYIDKIYQEKCKTNDFLK